MIPLYPATVMEVTLIGILIVQFPILVLSKVTSSFVPGTEAPPAPPDVADQLAVLFQLDEIAETQNLGEPFAT